jgi:DNA-binding IclR family transcriptional regulator
VPRWSFLTNHGQVLLYIARDPEARLIDIAAALGITERSAFAIVNDLASAGYVVKKKDGRRNRYEVQSHLLVPGPGIRSTTVAQLLALLVGDSGPASSVDSPPPVAAVG